MKSLKPSATIGALLAWFGCNTLLGIDESTCVGPCDGSASERSGAGSPSDDADERTDPALAAASAAEAPSTAPGASNAAEGEPGAELDELIADRCSAASGTDDGRSDDADQAREDPARQDPSEPFCIANNRVVCGAGAAAAIITVCASADHCERGVGDDCATCTTQAVCQGAELWRCDPRLGEMVRAGTCMSAALCDAVEGACLAPECLPGQTRCQGVSFEVCNASGSEFVRVEQCQTAVACDPEAGCEASECSAGQRRCAGGVLQECNSSGTSFDNLQNCGVPALCNAAEGRCNECIPGARRCADSGTVAVCDPSGLAEATSACQPLLEACEDGECVVLGGLPL